VRELAVLKAIGFSDRFVLDLVLAEALWVAILGGAVGLALAKWISLKGLSVGGILTVFYLSPLAIAAGIGLTVLVGMTAGLWPALSAMRLNIVNSLRKV
jgi:putative ABC transport system permease protein